MPPSRGSRKRAWYAAAAATAVVALHLTVGCLAHPDHPHGHTHRQAAPTHRHLLEAEAIPRVYLTPLPSPQAAPGQGIGTRRLLGETANEADAELDAPFGRRLALRFEAFGKEHHVELKLHDSLFAKEAVIRSTNPDGSEVVERPEAVAYTGTFLDGGWIRATVHDDDVVHAMWLDKIQGQINLLIPAHLYEHTAPNVHSHAKANGGRMLAFHLQDMDHSEHDRELLVQWLGEQMMDPTPRPPLAEMPPPFTSSSSYSVANITRHTNNPRKLQTMSSLLVNALVKSLSPYGLMASCPSTRYSASIGVAVDAGYIKGLTGMTATSDAATVDAAKRRVSKDIQTQINLVNFLYSDMGNVFISIAEIFIKTVAGGEVWNQEPLDAKQLTGANRHTYGCPVSRSVTDDSDYQKSLTDFGNWRASLLSTRKFSMWHLLTNCFPPPGTVGLAYIGSTCSTNYMGSSWASLQNEATFMTVAHEMGHNFGAYHTMTTGGIMSYDAITDKEYKFTGNNPSEICNHVNSVKGVCYGVLTPTCGNGVLEPGEDCDEGGDTACCDSGAGGTCKLKAGATCSPGLDSICCLSTCNYAPTFTGCNVPGGPETGYCYNGYCRFNRLAAAFSNLQGCNAPSTNPCKEYVRFNGGACTNTDASFGKSGYNMPDGAFCDTALTKSCKNGTCIASGPTRTPTLTAATKAPTRTPTQTPSRLPTRTPSRAPTRTPTNTPTNRPTKTPTTSPTRKPTRLPTRSPTQRPTRLPTRAPTGPTRLPTNAPVVARLLADEEEYYFNKAREMQEAEDGEETGSEDWGQDSLAPPVDAGPAVLINNPQVGETLYNGAIVLIRWTANVELSLVDIVLSDGTAIVSQGSAPQLNGTYYWNVRAKPSASYTMTVRAYPADGSATLVDESEIFAIQDQATVTLTAPTKDAVVIQGEASTIKWSTTAGGTITSVILSIVAANNGKELVSFGTQPNSGEYMWVPSSTLPQGRFSVLLSYSPPSQANITTRGDSFRLRKPAAEGAITFLAPTLGEALESGKSYTIMWTSPASLTLATIYLTQPGTGLSVQLYSGSDGNTFEWTVGLLPDNTQVPAGTGYQFLLFDSNGAGDRVENATSEAFSVYMPQPYVLITSMFDGQDGAMWVRGREALITFEASDPSDTLTLQIQDETGAVVFPLTTEAQVSTGAYTFVVPFQAPPSDCFSCFLVAISNRYPSIYHTFPTPFSIGSHEHSDLAAEQTHPVLTLNAPTEGTVLERGKQCHIAWTGVLIPSVVVLLTNHTTGETLPLAHLDNTGSYEWQVPLDPWVVGEYDLSLLGPETGLVTPGVQVTIVNPAPATPSLTLASEPPLPAVWSEGDSITVTYTSEGLVDPVTLQLFSTELGLLATLTDAAPTSGSFQFTVPAPPREPVTDAYLVLSTPAGASAQSATFTLYKAQTLLNVAVPAETLYKGQGYTVTWQTTGLAFPVAVLLYSGTPARLTVSGEPCVPWNDASGNHYTGCILSYDLVNEMCAIQVDGDGLWMAGGQCQPLSETFKLVLAVVDPSTPISSTDGQATLQLAASSTELPSPGETYTVVVAAATSSQQEAHSTAFAIASPGVLLDFSILQTDPGLALEMLRDVLRSFLATVLGIDLSRLILEMAPLSRHARDAIQYHVLARILASDATTDKASYEAAQGFVRQWEDPTSPLYADPDANFFQLDATTQPIVTFEDPSGAIPITQAPTPHAGLEKDGGFMAPTGLPGAEDKGRVTITTDETTHQEEGGEVRGFAPLASILGGVAALVGVAALLFMGLYFVRRQRPRARSVLRVQGSM